MLDEGGVHHPNLFRIHADLIEAQTRSGRREDAAENLARLRDDAKLTGSMWAAATAARCLAMLAGESDADGAFAEALRLHGDDPDELERARTVLSYGEWLRRRRRRRDSRDHLHEALGIFERLGARPWAERARAELRASGERLRRRGPAAHEQLTPQELQVSLAAAEGLTNKEIGDPALPQPEDGGVPSEPRVSQARGQLTRRAGQTVRIAAGHGRTHAGLERGCPRGKNRASRLRWGASRSATGIHACPEIPRERALFDQRDHGQAGRRNPSSAT